MSEAHNPIEADQEFHAMPNYPANSGYSAIPDYPAIVDLADANRCNPNSDEDTGPNPYIKQDEMAAVCEPAKAGIPAEISPDTDQVQDPEEFLRALDEALAAVRTVSNDDDLERQMAGSGLQIGTSDERVEESSKLTERENTPPEIPNAFQVQARQSRGIGLFAILAGFASIVLAGFLALYFMNYPMSLPGFGQTPIDIQTAPPVVEHSRIEQPVDLQPIQVASVVVRANPTIAIHPVEGVSGAAIPLRVEIDPVAGLGASLAISGLPEGAGLSAGIETSRGAWLVDANALASLALFTPMGATGSYDIRVQLIGQDGKVVDSKLLPVRLLPGNLNVPAPATNSTADVQAKDQSRIATSEDVETSNGENDLVAKIIVGNQLASTSGSTPMPITPITSIDPSVIVDQADTLLARGDIETARTLYEEAANAGDAEAALKAGMTYDPLYLSAEAASVNSTTAEPGTSLVWYARAIGLGSSAAEPRRDALNSFIATN